MSDLLDRRQCILLHWHIQVLAQVNLPIPSPTAGCLFRPLDLSQGPLLLRQRRIQLSVSLMLLEPGLGQLLLGSREDRLAEMLRAKLTDQGQSRRRKEHLLPHGSIIGHMCDGEELRRSVMAAQDSVEGSIGLDVRLEGGKVVGERGRLRLQGFDGDEGFLVDGDDETKGTGRFEQRGELSLELLGGWEASAPQRCDWGVALT